MQEPGPDSSSDPGSQSDSISYTESDSKSRTPTSVSSDSGSDTNSDVTKNYTAEKRESVNEFPIQTMPPKPHVSRQPQPPASTSVFYTPPAVRPRITPPLRVYFLPPPAPCRGLPPSIRYIQDFVTPAVEADLRVLAGKSQCTTAKPGDTSNNTVSCIPPTPPRLPPSCPFKHQPQHWSCASLRIFSNFSEFGSTNMIILRCPPNQGIFRLTGRPELGEIVISVSLASSTHMDFYWNGNQEPSFSLPLSPRSLLILSEEARYSWKHGIKGENVHTQRISYTFRGDAPHESC